MFVYFFNRQDDTLTSVNSCEWRQLCSFSCLVCLALCRCMFCYPFKWQRSGTNHSLSTWCTLTLKCTLTLLCYSSSHGDTFKDALTLPFSLRSSLNADTLQQFSANTAVLWNKANTQTTLTDLLPIACTWLGDMTSCAVMSK